MLPPPPRKLLLEPPSEPSTPTTSDSAPGGPPSEPPGEPQSEPSSDRPPGEEGGGSRPGGPKKRTFVLYFEKSRPPAAAMEELHCAALRSAAVGVGRAAVYYRNPRSNNSPAGGLLVFALSAKTPAGGLERRWPGAVHDDLQGHPSGWRVEGAAREWWQALREVYFNGSGEPRGGPVKVYPAAVGSLILRAVPPKTPGRGKRKHETALGVDPEESPVA